MKEERALAAQLEVLCTIIRATERAGIPVWFIGGYGVDALEGRITRQHGDIDILARAEDAGRLRDAALRNGFSIDDVEPPHHAMVSRGGQHVDCVFWQERDDGLQVIDTGQRGVYVCPEGALPDEPNGTLCGLPVRAAGYELLYCLKAGFSRYAPETELRQKDREDLELLRRHISSERLEALEAHFEPLPGTRRAPG